MAAAFQSNAFQTNAFEVAAAGGSATANGVTLTATSLLIAGAASGAASAAGTTLATTAALTAGSATGAAQAAGTTLTATSSLTVGAATGSASAAGQTLAAATTLVAGNATGAAEAQGGTLTTTALFIGGNATAGGAAVATGEIIVVSASLLPGAANADTFEPPVSVGGGSQRGFSLPYVEPRSREKWLNEIAALLDAPDTPITSPQAVQDAPSEPRTARPAPIALERSTALAGLVDALQPYSIAQAQVAAFMDAMRERDRQQAVEQALALESLLTAIRQDEDEVLLLLLEAA